MTNAWDEKRKAQEEGFFDKKEKEALAKLKEKTTEIRNCPVNGDPMEPVVMAGVRIDRCRSCGGVWLDKGELDLIIKASNEQSSQGNKGWLTEMLTKLMT